MAAVLYLTLSPRPFGGIRIPLFPGADKVVHGVMFLAVAFSLCLDFSRGGKFRGRLAAPLLFAFAAAVALGGLIEVGQWKMAMGRSGDVLDLLADAVGAAIGCCCAAVLLLKGRER